MLICRFSYNWLLKWLPTCYKTVSFTSFIPTFLGSSDGRVRPRSGVVSVTTRAANLSRGLLSRRRTAVHAWQQKTEMKNWSLKKIDHFYGYNSISAKLLWHERFWLFFDLHGPGYMTRQKTSISVNDRFSACRGWLDTQGKLYRSVPPINLN
jgi:hypothetical protein